MTSLAPFAARPSTSLGRIHDEGETDIRNPYQRDRDRIVHCSAFRRLQYKTQVFVNHEGDMFRSRLTHSLEVSQIARTVARELMLNEDLTEAICLAHDMGHTPFGHAGQKVLNERMVEHGGFEHNLQTLRIVDVLEEPYLGFSGLNLMYETREGVLKHCSRAKARKLGKIGQRFIDKKQPSLEAQLANIADEIAYNNHDVDDGMRAGILILDDLRECDIIDEQFQVIADEDRGLSDKQMRRELVRRMINEFVTDLISTSKKNLEDSNVASISTVRDLSLPLINLSPKMSEKHSQLKRYLRKHLYSHKRVSTVAQYSQTVINDLFDLYIKQPQLMSMNDDVSFSRKEANDSADTFMIIIKDYIAGMTDRFALLEHQRLTETDCNAKQDLYYG